LLRIDPESRARSSAPGEFAHRARDVRHAVVLPDGEAEPETVARRQRPQHRGLNRVEVIGRHVGDRRPAEQPRAVELSAVQQHLQKARVVARRARGAGTPGVVLLLTGNGWASRATFSFGTTNEVSFILSGVNTRSARNVPSGIPETFSTTRPSTSVERLYSHVVPGWCASGACARRSICSADVTFCQSTPSLLYAAFT